MHAQRQIREQTAIGLNFGIRRILCRLCRGDSGKRGDARKTARRTGEGEQCAQTPFFDNIHIGTYLFGYDDITIIP